MSEAGGAIVVGYDASDCADMALTAAMDIAAATGDTVVLVFASAPGGYGGGEVPAQREAVEELGRQALDRGVGRAGERGVAVETEMLAEKPERALIDVAAQRRARMIVVGTHSEPPLKGAIIGSTPHKLLGASEVPVLVVPAG